MPSDLTQEEERVAALLTGAGLSRNVARVTTYLHKAGEATSKHIERATGLRQPEVSLAVKDLRERGWIKEREMQREGKGRPLKSYKLARNFGDIVHGVANQKREELRNLERDLDELERMCETGTCLSG